jgi:DNA-binding beta-propeller fold protein YncE
VNLVPRRLLVLLAIVSIALPALAGSAQAALSVAPTRTFGMSPLYGLAPDGTIWTTPTGESSTASFSHFDDEGNDLGDGFSVSRSSYYPLGIGFYGNRVYVTVAGSFGGRLISYQANSADPAHDLLSADVETNERIGSNQAALRVFGDGSMAVALGQENKVGTLDGKDLTQEHPFYPQGFHGAGINQNFTAEPPLALESCVVGLGGAPVFGEPENCGTEHGRSGVQGPEGVNYPNDIAFGLGGIYISERFGNEITHYNTVANPGATLDLRFGVGPGSGAGQLSTPVSIVRQPSTGWLYVSEEGNRRISVFDGDGNFIAAFGYGVRDGSDTMQVCGLEIGPCQAGVSFLADSRSLFTRLDFAPNGDLYAFMPLTGQIQVFGVGGGPGGGGSTGGGSAGGGGSGVPPSVPAILREEEDKVRIKAKPLQVAKGGKTKLTAIVNPPGTCRQRLVLFQLKEKRSWDNLGKALKPGSGCTASKRVKVTAKSVFRAVLIGGSNHATLGYSPSLTVRLK